MSEPRSCPLDEHGAVFKESDSTLTMPSAPGDWGAGGHVCSLCPFCLSLARHGEHRGDCGVCECAAAPCGALIQQHRGGGEDRILGGSWSLALKLVNMVELLESVPNKELWDTQPNQEEVWGGGGSALVSASPHTVARCRRPLGVSATRKLCWVQLWSRPRRPLPQALHRSS